MGATSLSAFFLCFIFISLISSGQQEKFDEYTPDTFPDSNVDWERCGLSEPGLVCDPNGLLNNNGVNALEETLQFLRKNTRCICENADTVSKVKPKGDQFVMGQGVQLKCATDKPHGYTISVAVLNKIHESGQHTREHLASVFSNALRNRLNRGQCNDDAFVILSVKDNAIWTATGAMISPVLTPEFIRNVSKRAQNLFSHRDYTNGILQMVNDYAFQLGAPPQLGPNVKLEEDAVPGWFDLHFWPLMPEWLRESEWRWLIVSSILLALLILIALIIVAIVLKLRGRNHSAGYTPGRQQQTVGGEYYKS